MNLLSLLGIKRWIESLSDGVKDAMVEGASGLEARSLLAKKEWLVEKARLQQLMLYAVLCMGLTVGVLMGVSLGVVVTFWDSEYRILAAWLVVGFWVVILLFCLLRLRSVILRGQNAFKYTKQELGKDWDAIKDQF